MIATTAKPSGPSGLRELRSLAEDSYVPRCRCRGQNYLYHQETCADGMRLKDLARLVLTLSSVLERAALGKEPQVRGYHEPLCDQCCGCAARKALAAVEELEL